MLEEIKQIAEKNRELLEAYLRLESVSAQGRQMIETAEMVARIITDKGGRAELLYLADTEAPPIVYGEFSAGPGGNAEKTLLFYNHYDVQPEDPLEEWQTDPFVPTEREGKLYCRGVSDNKANFIARINAIEYYLGQEGGLPCNVKFLLEGEEEIGSPHIEAYLAQYAEKFAADACIWESGGKDAAERM